MHCYASFGEPLQADLLWMHQALKFSDSTPDVPEPDTQPDPENLARWRLKLAEAIRLENYGEAARLRLLIRNAEAYRKVGGGLGLA